MKKLHDEEIVFAMKMRSHGYFWKVIARVLDVNESYLRNKVHEAGRVYEKNR